MQNIERHNLLQKPGNRMGGLTSPDPNNSSCREFKSLREILILIVSYGNSYSQSAILVMMVIIK
jgi:hypothetical protein